MSLAYSFFMEIWKDAIGYKGLYLVSNLGNVKSLKYGKERILKPINTGNGYYKVTLYDEYRIKKRIFVHRLVWESFNGKTNLPIDHIIEGNPSDNRLENLQAISFRQNTSKHRLTTKKTSKYVGVSWSKERNKWVAKYNIGSKQVSLGRFNSELEAHFAYQCAIKQIPFFS